MAITNYDEYQSKYNTYKGLAGKKDPASLQARRDIAKDLQNPAYQQFRNPPPVPLSQQHIGDGSQMGPNKSTTSTSAPAGPQGVINANPQAAPPPVQAPQPTQAAPTYIAPTLAPAPTYDPSKWGLGDGSSFVDPTAQVQGLGLGNGQFDDSDLPRIKELLGAQWSGNSDAVNQGLANGKFESEAPRDLSTGQAFGVGQWDDVVSKFMNYVKGGGQYQLPSKAELGQLMNNTYQQEIADTRQAGGVDAKQTQQRRAREQLLADRGISFDSDAYRTDQRNTEGAIAAEDAGIRSQARDKAMQLARDTFQRQLDASTFERDSAFKPFEMAGNLRTKDLDRGSQEKVQDWILGQDSWKTRQDLTSKERVALTGILSDEWKHNRSLNSDERKTLANILSRRSETKWTLTSDEKKVMANIFKDVGIAKSNINSGERIANAGYAKDYDRMGLDRGIAQGNLDLGYANLNEGARHSVEMENQGQQTIDESIRHNKESEVLEGRGLDINARAVAETIRNNKDLSKDRKKELIQRAKEAKDNKALKLIELDIQRMAVRKSGNKASPDDEYKSNYSATQGKTDGYYQSLIDMGYTPAEAREIATGRKSEGKGGVSVSAGG